MRILLLTQYYAPESVGPAIWLQELATELASRNHEITVLTAFPNHPEGRIFREYRGHFHQREMIDGIPVVRCWLHATPSKKFWSRAVSFATFTGSSLAIGLLLSEYFDVIYTILQPLTLGITARLLGIKTRSKVVLNIQDIHPYAAIALGVLRNPIAIRSLQILEKWNYQKADHIVVISDGFKENLIAKGVLRNKVTTISNWADPAFISPGVKQNDFRTELGVDREFTLIYSGGLTHNSNLEPVIDAAELLRDEPFVFVIVGEGVKKRSLQHLAEDRQLENVRFRPFVPLKSYPDVLRAADMNLVTLSSQATYTSVPSKVFKQMASGRPILAITAEGNELDRLAKSASFGLRVPPDDPACLAEVLRWANKHPVELEEMGANGRRYLERYYSRSHCVEQLDQVLQRVVSQ